MEMTYHVGGSIELGISSDGINSEIYVDLICIYDIGECCHDNYV